jgi:diamine N-acetyltransferase
VSLSLREAAPGDTAVVFGLIRELADYEKLSAEMIATPEQIAAVLFAPQPRVFCDIAEWNGEAAGLALWFLNFSSFRGRHGIYLEDLFVRPSLRGKGIGKALMRQLARRCVTQGYARFEWTVLEWNEPSIAFYKSIGARMLDDWRVCRISGEALQRFAEAEPP